MTQFYRVSFDNRLTDLCYLGEPRNALGQTNYTWSFTLGKVFCGQEELTVDMQRSGRTAAFNFAAFHIPILASSLAMRMSESAPHLVQVIPVHIEHETGKWSILNVLDVVDCLDEERSQYVTKWTETDGRPDRIGQYRGVGRLVVDPARARGHSIFRLAGFLVALIINEDLKQVIERIERHGVVFTAV